MQALLSPAQDAQLIANGYEPVVVQGKAPVVETWQTASTDLLPLQRKAYPEARNTGLRTGRLAAVDIDVVKPEAVQAIISLADDVLGYTPLRRFGSKGMMLCYQNAEPIRKITISTEAAEPGQFADKVEVLGTGLQFVAFGVHPDTQKPFTWTGEDAEGDIATPLNVPFVALPVVTPAMLEDFAKRCADKMGALGYTKPTVRRAYEAEKATREHDADEDAAVNIDRAIRHLKNCVERGELAVMGALGNDMIYNLACCLLDRFYLSEGKALELMLTHWYPHCIPNTLEDEVATIVTHAASYIQNEPGARANPPAAEAFREALDKLPRDDAKQPGENDLGDAQDIVIADENFDDNDHAEDATAMIAEDYPPLRELVPTWCERNVNTMHEGPPATHKSRTLLQDAIALQAGLPILGLEVERCGVIYMNYENSREEMQRRILKIKEFLRRDNKMPEVPVDDLQIWNLRQKPKQILIVNRDGIRITRFGKRFLHVLASRRNAGKHTLVIFDGLMDAIVFRDNTRNDEFMAMQLIHLVDSWCEEYDFTAQSIFHPARTAERSGGSGSYAQAWSSKPRCIQQYKRILNPFAGYSAKAKITEDTPLSDIFIQRRVQKRSNGPEGDRVMLEYSKGGLIPHLPPRRSAKSEEQPAQDVEQLGDDTEL